MAKEYATNRMLENMDKMGFYNKIALEMLLDLARCEGALEETEKLMRNLKPE